MYRRALSGVVLAFLSACATVPERLGVTRVADDLARADVVFLGEEHDNAIGHEQHLQLLRLFHERRADIVLSMEMFERDVQGHLDAYLAGGIDETEFLAKSRPWRTYARFYRPMVEYCKQHGLPVIAANVPRDLANEVASKGESAAAGAAHAARSFSYPKDAYWERFQVAMADHVGVDAKQTLFRFYQSQCLKDDTMAESITDYLNRARAEGRTPMVVHVCGKFHSDERLGTVQRVADRKPELRLAVLSMEVEPNVRRDLRGDFVLMVPPEPQRPERSAAAPKSTTPPEGVAPAASATRPAPSEEPPPVDPLARPGLGFMPGYDDDVIGVRVDGLRSGGPAETAGIREGDIIVKLGADPIESVADYMAVLSNQRVGSRVSVEIERGGERITLHVVVGESHR
jgi:uncharacterized iron-regulated protein